MLGKTIDKYYNFRIRRKTNCYLQNKINNSSNFKLPRVTYSIDQSLDTPTDILVEHRGRTINFACRGDIYSTDYPNAYGFLKDRSAVYVHYLALTRKAGSSIICDTSDGNNPSMADIRFSSPFLKDGLVPDIYFHSTHGYQHMRSLYKNNSLPWEERSDKMIWRGGANGNGLRICDESLTSNAAINQRIRFAIACKNTEIDFRFVNAEEFGVLERMNLTGCRIDSATWLQRKFAIDIDGFSNAWDNLYHRLLFGCCVLKVDSQIGFRQWYYNKLKPFENYIPIKADLSDLHDQLDWVRSHPQDVKDIAASGCELAHSMTFETEMRYAVDEINRICDAKKLFT